MRSGQTANRRGSLRGALPAADVDAGSNRGMMMIKRPGLNYAGRRIAEVFFSSVVRGSSGFFLGVQCSLCHSRALSALQTFDPATFLDALELS
jgi:hypothetical protein